TFFILIMTMICMIVIVSLFDFSEPPEEPVKAEHYWLFNDKGNKEWLVAEYGNRTLVIDAEYVNDTSANLSGRNNIDMVPMLWPGFYLPSLGVKGIEHSVDIGFTFYRDIYFDKSYKPKQPPYDLKYKKSNGPGPLFLKDDNAFGREHYFYYNQSKINVRCNFDVEDSFNTKPTDNCRIFFSPDIGLIVRIDVEGEAMRRWGVFGKELFLFLDHIFIEPDEDRFKFDEFMYNLEEIRAHE
ncbi:hypothetical protein, partial [Pleionea mediterranea]